MVAGQCGSTSSRPLMSRCEMVRAGLSPPPSNVQSQPGRAAAGVASNARRTRHPATCGLAMTAVSAIRRGLRHQLTFAVERRIEAFVLGEEEDALDGFAQRGRDQLAARR